MRSELPGVARLCIVLECAKTLYPLRFWAEQQYLQSISLAPAFAALAARIPTGEVEDFALLMDLAHEETWGLHERNHGEAFKVFFASIGGDLGRLGKAPFLPEAVSAAEDRLAIARGSNNETFHASLEAIATANEAANLTIFGMLAEATRGPVYAGMSRHYFNCHLADEEAHCDRLKALAAKYKDGASVNEAYATNRLLAARDRFFAAVADALVPFS